MLLLYITEEKGHTARNGSVDGGVSKVEMVEMLSSDEDDGDEPARRRMRVCGRVDSSSSDEETAAPAVGAGSTAKDLIVIDWTNRFNGTARTSSPPAPKAQHGPAPAPEV